MVWLVKTITFGEVCPERLKKLLGNLGHDFFLYKLYPLPQNSRVRRKLVHLVVKKIKCKYVFSTCYIPDTVLRTGNILVRKKQLWGRRGSH